MTIDDVLVVAPYNAQVNLLKIGPAARGAGRHDRQVPGTGGAVVLVSMTTSSGD